MMCVCGECVGGGGGRGGWSSCHRWRSLNLSAVLGSGLKALPYGTHPLCPHAIGYTQALGQGTKEWGVLPTKSGPERWRSQERRRELVPLLKQEIRGRDEQGNIGHPHTESQKTFGGQSLLLTAGINKCFCENILSAGSVTPKPEDVGTCKWPLPRFHYGFD